MAEHGWMADYGAYVGGEPFQRDNPKKASLNKELGMRINRALGGKVARGRNGKPITVPVKNSIIRRYTQIVPSDAKGGDEMKQESDTLEGIKELTPLVEGQHISWTSTSPQLTHEMTIYPETLTVQQQERQDQIEQQLLDLAYKAKEESERKLCWKAKMPRASMYRQFKLPRQ